MAASVSARSIVPTAAQREEYERLNDRDKELFETMIPYRKELHRYLDIRPYANNNVEEVGSAIALEGAEESQVIVTSAPVKDSIDHFFQMMFKSFSGREGVILLNLAPKGQGSYPYLPEASGESRSMSRFVAVCKTVHTEELGDWNAHCRTITLSSPTECDLTFTQIHVLDWEDNTPAAHGEMLALVKRVYGASRHHFLVHCSAGVGRAGQFINSYKIYTALKTNPKAEIRAFEVAQSSIESRTRLGIHRREQYYQLEGFIEVARADVLKDVVSPITPKID